MIFYFTATGNSLYVAKQLGENIISIPQAMHDEKKVYTADRIGIVSPVYGHDLPKMVKEFISRSTFKTPYLYVIVTYGSDHSGAGAWISALFERCRKSVNYVNDVLMVDNFLPGFDVAEELRIKNDSDIDRKIRSIKKDISEKKDFILPASRQDKLRHKEIAERLRIMTEEVLKDLYTINDNCICCRLCEMICPAGCFSMGNGKSMHDCEGCQMCFACIHACPFNAIRLNMGDLNPDARFLNGHIGLEEIVDANCQMNFVGRG